MPFYPAGEKWGTTAEPITKMQKPLPPEKSVKHYSVPEGFEMKLFAADEQFGGKPIAMTWDERGRLWAAVTVDYPNEMQPQGEGRDKIVVLEDTDGDGKARQGHDVRGQAEHPDEPAARPRRGDRARRHRTRCS